MPPMQTPETIVPTGFPCGKTFLLPGPAGGLEVMTACPDPSKEVAATVVICHPHPVQGGTMHNKVVHTLARSFGELGMRTLRFNFRGVGASEGSFDHGEGETDDVHAVLHWTRTQRPQDEIWLAGFSFGGYVAARAAHRFDVKQLLTVAPAVHLYSFATMKVPPTRWLVIQGDADEVVSVDAVREWVVRRHPSPELVILPGVDHFFHGRLHDLRAVVHERLGERRPRRI
jgi:uncharacterized protein